MIDRYLCTFDGFQEGCKGNCKTCQIDKLECNRTTIQDGWDNVVYILDQILPEYLNEDFHVLLIYDVLDNKKANNYNTEQALENFEKWTKTVNLL